MMPTLSNDLSLFYPSLPYMKVVMHIYMHAHMNGHVRIVACAHTTITYLCMYVGEGGVGGD